LLAVIQRAETTRLCVYCHATGFQGFRILQTDPGIGARCSTDDFRGIRTFPPAEFARYLEFARASLIETQNHLDDALDGDYITTDLHHELFKLAERAIGATTKLQQYLQSCKEPSSRRSGNARPRAGTLNPEPRTPNAEPRTQNER
jgi:hypothetical protein